MKRIAIFQNDLNIGGIQKSLINLLNNLDYDKCEVDLFLVEKNNIFINEINENVNVIYLNKMPYISKVIPFEILMKRYNPSIDKQYDVSIDFNSYSGECAIGAIKANAKTKIIWIHNDVKIKLKEEIKYKILHFFFKKKYEYFDKFVAVSKGALDSFKEVHKLNNKSYEVIPNIIDIDDILKKKDEKCDLVVSNEKINVVSVGRIEHQKGFDILINEINKIKDQISNYHFYIVGDGRKYPSLKKTIEELKLDDYITFLGYQKNPYNIMDKMDAFVLTSRYEGQGIVFLEAYLLGLDVIIPNHLTKYVDGFKGTDDVSLSLLNLKKHEKHLNDLTAYNKNIIEKFNNL